MPEAHVDHIYDYPKGYIADILKSVQTIAMVGASGDKTKFSYGVLRVLHETGYEMLPVNPNPNIKEIRGLKVFHSLKEIFLKSLLLSFKVDSVQEPDRTYS